MAQAISFWFGFFFNVYVLENHLLQKSIPSTSFGHKVACPKARGNFSISQGLLL